MYLKQMVAFVPFDPGSLPTQSTPLHPTVLIPYVSLLL